ncbi:MAG: hypothetical protein WC593_13820 [Methanoregula sp.]
MKRILIVSGRYQTENPYRELAIKRQFEASGYETVFALPDRTINEHGYEEGEITHNLCKKYGAVIIHSPQDFKQQVRLCDAVLFGSWKTYGSLAKIARTVGRPVLNFNSTSGLDHWPHYVDCAFVKGPFSKRQILYFQNIIQGYGNLRENQIIVTGSVAHEQEQTAKRDALPITKDEFCDFYNFDASRPIITFFPKGIGSFAQKVGTWFKDSTSAKKQEYNDQFIKKYFEICKSVRDSDCNLLIKMHPTAYVSYKCKTDDEYAFWQKIPWAKILDPIHTYDCYRHTDCGIGINTHSSLDLGYFGKPFIYVDSDRFTPPDAVQFHINHLCSLPLGPSSHWDNVPLTQVNPWFPSWLGLFSRIENLSYVLKTELPLKIPEVQKNRFISEFWYKSDGKSSERIVDGSIEFINKYKPTLLQKIRGSMGI